MPRDFSQYEIPENHLQLLNRMCGLPEFSDQSNLPTDLVQQYIKDRKRADVITLGLDASHLWNIVCRSGISGAHLPELEQKQPTIFDDHKNGRVKIGDYVFCRWRSETEHKIPGQLVGFDPHGRPNVRFLGSPDERTLNIHAVIPAPEGWKPERGMELAPQHLEDDQAKKRGRPRKEEATAAS